MNEIRVSEAVRNARLPSLDGLRGISIALVISFHLIGRDFSIFTNGDLGVAFFFVISGFLITTLCLRERESTDNIRLLTFYKRRILRIFPLAYLYLIIVLLLLLILKEKIPFIQFLGCFFYVTDVSYFRSHNFFWPVGHYWSLSVEEQFYLIFPWLLWRSFRLFIYVVVFVVFIIPLFCIVQYFIPELNYGVLYFLTHLLVKFQGIGVGCIFAILAFKGRLDFFRLNNWKAISSAILLILIFALKYDPFYSLRSIFINLSISLLIGGFIIINIVPSKNIVFRILNFNPLRYIGTISYSLYIWQQLFTGENNIIPPIMLKFPFNLICLFIVANLSYWYYERYFLELKTKLH